MNALIATELLKLRITRTWWGFAAAAAALSAARLVMVVSSAGTAGGVTAGTAEATLTMIGAGGFGTLVLVLFGTTAVAGEFRHATITATFVNIPRRRSVIIAKTLAYAAAGAVAGTAGAAVALVAAVLTGLAGPVNGAVVHAVIAMVLGAVFLTLLGVGVGLVVHNQTAALILPLVWLLVVEPLTGSYGLRFLHPWLPGTLPGELGPWNAPGSLPSWLAAVVLVAYVLALGAIGARRLERADIS